MVHIFLVKDDNSPNEYFRMVVEANLNDAEECLKRFSSDVRYISSRKRNKYDKGNRRLSERVIVRACSRAYIGKAIKKTDSINTCPVDERHTVLEGNNHG